MSLSLNLELQSDDSVLVTNSLDRETRLVSLSYLRQVTNNNLNLLLQYKSYKVIIDPEKVWNRLKHFNPIVDKAEREEIDRRFKEIYYSENSLEITDEDKDKYSEALFWNDIYDSQRESANTVKVVRQFEKLGWKIIERNREKTILINNIKENALFIPNTEEIKKEVFAKIINKSGFTLKEFFSV